MSALKSLLALAVVVAVMLLLLGVLAKAYWSILLFGWGLL